MTYKFPVCSFNYKFPVCSFNYSGQSDGMIITNLALLKPARQSSLYDNRGLAEHAVDGNVDGNYNSKSSTHTSVENQAWWEVDLHVESEIFSVYIYNRVDCCQERLTNFDVKFYDYAHRLVKSVHYGGTAMNEYGIGMHPPVVARYVQVQLRGRNALSMAEVQVLGNGAGGKWK